MQRDKAEKVLDNMLERFNNYSGKPVKSGKKRKGKKEDESQQLLSLFKIGY